MNDEFDVVSFILGDSRFFFGSFSLVCLLRDFGDSLGCTLFDLRVIFYFINDFTVPPYVPPNYSNQGD